ncbi:hypothetical protein FNH05_37320, partial [Amycolatopsis rhizosphaerae]
MAVDNPLYAQNGFEAMLAKDAAPKMFTPDDIKEMRAKLDDPYVSREAKQDMLYALSDMNAITPEEIGKYSGLNGLDTNDILFGGRAPMQNLKNGQMALKVAREQSRTGAAKKALDDSQKRLDEGKFNNSDEIIDQADVALRIFDDFYPRFAKAGGQAPQGGAAAPGGGLDPQSLREATKQFRGIDFTAFKTDADALTQAGKAVTDAGQQLASAWGTNMADWQGSAATAAGRFKSKLDGAAGRFSQALGNAPATITQGIDTVEKQVVDFAKQVHNIYGDGLMAHLSPQQVDELLKAKDELPGVISQLQQKIQELNNRSTFDKVAGAVIGFAFGGLTGLLIGVLGISVADKITEDNIQEETQKYQQALADSQTKLQMFVTDYSTKAGAVQQ